MSLLIGLRNVLLIGILGLILGHSICTHSHAYTVSVINSEQTNDFSNFLKRLFSVNQGEGQLKDYRIENCSFDFKFSFIKVCSDYKSFLQFVDKPIRTYLLTQRIKHHFLSPKLNLQIVRAIVLARGSPQNK